MRPRRCSQSDASGSTIHLRYSFLWRRDLYGVVFSAGRRGKGNSPAAGKDRLYRCDLLLGVASADPWFTFILVAPGFSENPPLFLYPSAVSSLHSRADGTVCFAN